MLFSAINNQKNLQILTLKVMFFFTNFLFHPPFTQIIRGMIFELNEFVCLNNGSPLLCLSHLFFKTPFVGFFVLRRFFKAHPQYAKNDFYITGESYAGHYIPAFAARVHNGNKAREGLHINLKGFAIDNGLTHPEIQYKAYPDYALDNGIIKQLEHKTISVMVPAYEQVLVAKMHA
ncbi:serine carboxypeptidase-like 49 [Spinacia oleracea]|uniref:Carboxypeptidase n=1 Tax=Spinacia oleracea TaxID=3562 RepID=A0ABM3RJH6_SPIOL|nr:serine carboxypeptidase-like 49 [Spinacia oleracea]